MKTKPFTSSTAIVVSDCDPLAVLDEIEYMLTTITNVERAIEIIDQADALSKLVRHAMKGFLAQNKCAYIKLLAQRRAGELLRDIPQAPIGGAQSGRGEKHSHTKGECLLELGVSAQAASRWEQLATLPPELITNEWLKADTAGEELTEKRVHVIVQAIVRERREAEWDALHPKRSAHMREEQATLAAYDWLRKHTQEFLLPGNIAPFKLTLILEDRTHISREEINRLRTDFFTLSQRASAACEALTERMDVPMTVPLLEPTVTDETRARIKSAQIPWHSDQRTRVR